MFIHIKAGATPQAVAVLKQPMGQENYTEAVAAWLPQLFATPVDAPSTKPSQWKTLRVPTMFIWGEADNITPLKQAKDLSKLVAGSKIETLPGVGHVPQIEAPGAFRERLIKALDEMTK